MLRKKLKKSQTQLTVSMRFILLGIPILAATCACAHPENSNDAPPTSQTAGKQHYAEPIIKGAKQVLQSNGIPMHAVGQFPNRRNLHTITP